MTAPATASSLFALQKKRQTKPRAPTAAGANGAGTSAGDTTTKDGSRIPTNIDTLLCEICNAGHQEDKIILCDRCDKGFHLFCLSPPLDDVPEGDWVRIS